MTQTVATGGADPRTEQLPAPAITLDRVQREVANSPEGPVLIIGGPGTGKTHSMLARILKLMESGARPHTITYVTFNSRSAEDARRRLEQIAQVSNIYIGTIHQLASHFLRQAGASIMRLSPHYTIWDRDQAEEVISDLVGRPELGLQEKPGEREIKRIVRWHSHNRSLMPDQKVPADNNSPHWHTITDAYQAEKRSQNALDLDDLVPVAIAALEVDPQTRNLWNSIRTRHLLVDEFQDITPVQYRLLQLLTGPTKSITIATDPNQSIYSWLGADAKLLDRFKAHHRDAEQHLLRVNHRCLSTITAMGDAMTENPQMAGLYPSYQVPIRPGGEPPRSVIYECQPRHMDQLVIDEAQEAFNNQEAAWEEMAFVYARNVTGDRLSTTLDAKSIPYTRLGQSQDVTEGETKAIISLLRSTINPRDKIAMAYAASSDNGRRRSPLNALDANNISAIARQSGADLVQAAREYMSQVKRGSRTAQNLRYFLKAHDVITRMLEDPEVPLSNVCKETLAQLHDKEGGGFMPSPTLETGRLIIRAETSERRPGENARNHLARFLEIIAQAPYPEHRDGENEDPAEHHQGLTLATVHASKGTQWKLVWIIDSGNNNFPGQLFKRNTPMEDSEKEEKQRIFYVASTRAANRLTFCTSMIEPGKDDIQPSPFLEIVKNYIQEELVTPNASPT